MSYAGPGPRPPTVAAVLLPGERLRVDAAGNGCFAVVHRDSLPDALRVVRERGIDAVLLSVHRCPPEQLDAVNLLVRDFPGIPTVALVSHHDPVTTDTLLRLGASGVRQVVDVTSPLGWRRLRQLMSEPVSRAVGRLQAPLLAAVADSPPDAQLFFEALIRLAPVTCTVRRLTTRLHVRPSTLMSRFARQGLPSPKTYLALMRLLHATLLFEEPGLSIADVAYRLEYSSPQSFGRHLRTLLGMTSSEFRRRFPFELAVARFLELMITPYRAALRTFHPLAGRTALSDIPPPARPPSGAPR